MLGTRGRGWRSRGWCLMGTGVQFEKMENSGGGWQRRLCNRVSAHNATEPHA